MSILAQAHKKGDLSTNASNLPRSSATTSVWWLYLIATAKQHLYCGVSTDVQRRYTEHSSHPRLGSRYLRGKGPLSLVFEIEIGTRSQAQRAEYFVKNMNVPEKRRLIAGCDELKKALLAAAYTAK
ncbi:MAG: GIY-YIG nuclease family protein [Oleibacter sp.]|nr:GIY-YIG nuclease family protein [Thalassolituus sp.]